VIALFAALAAYIIGGFPTGVLVSRLLLGSDVRAFGSGNPGAVNVWRTFGIKWGLAVVAVDIGKGYLAVTALAPLAGDGGWAGYPAFLGLLAVAGHIWSPFTRFRGGKGVGAAAGAALGLHPLIAGVIIAVWLTMALLTKYSSVASLSAAICYPAAVYHLNAPSYFEMAAAMLLPAMLIWTHRDNLRRLRAGSELKIGRGGGVGH